MPSISHQRHANKTIHRWPCAPQISSPMKKYMPILCISILVNMHALRAVASTDSLLRVLDTVIIHRTYYQQKKEARLAIMQQQMHSTTSAIEQDQILTRLFEAYLPYNTDSAYQYAIRKEQLAHKMNQPDKVAESQINLAAVLCITGNYKEALEKLQPVRSLPLTDTLLQYYYHQARTIYGAMADYTSLPEMRRHYMQLTDCYRDSILTLTNAGSLDAAIVKGDQLIVQRKYAEALSLLKPVFDTIALGSHNQAIVAYMMAEAHVGMNHRDEALYHLTISAIADIRATVKEYISLWQLATLLHQQGDTKRAHQYLQCSLDDAAFSKARLRTLKISEIYPIIDKAYQAQLNQQHRRVVTLLLVVSVLTILLIVAVVLVWRQLRKTSTIRTQLIEANQQLQQANDSLRHTNLALSEAGIIKENYIARYMDLCSVYIEKLDTYRRSLNKLAVTGKTHELMQTLKSTTHIDDELREFYASFDDSFLRLFPTFVTDFNNLLVDTERVTPKPGEQLNTELRIYALIRLGISDSEKIARFLRYSVTTIYNYRTKTRNKAAVARADFEKMVMLIGAEMPTNIPS